MISFQSYKVRYCILLLYYCLLCDIESLLNNIQTHSCQAPQGQVDNKKQRSLMLVIRASTRSRARDSPNNPPPRKDKTQTFQIRNSTVYCLLPPPPTPLPLIASARLSGKPTDLSQHLGHVHVLRLRVCLAQSRPHGLAEVQERAHRPLRRQGVLLSPLVRHLQRTVIHRQLLLVPWGKNKNKQIYKITTRAKN